MKRILTALVCALGLGFTATNANALAIGDEYYLGQIIPGLASNPANEVDFINSLIVLGAGAGATPCNEPGGNPDDLCNRIGSTVGGPFPTATTAASVKEEPTNGTINASGFAYVYAKYGGAGTGDQKAYVWFVNFTQGFVTVPTAGLSHLSLYVFDPDVPLLPDGGATLGLLGLSMLGLGYLRRRLG